MLFLSSMSRHTPKAQYFKVSRLPCIGALPTVAAKSGSQLERFGVLDDGQQPVAACLLLSQGWGG